MSSHSKDRHRWHINSRKCDRFWKEPCVSQTGWGEAGVAVALCPMSGSASDVSYGGGGQFLASLDTHTA
jgi:hypothetical protein